MFLLVLLLFVLTYYYILWLKVIKSGSGPLISGSLPIIGYTHKLIGNTQGLWNVFKEMTEHSLKNNGVSRAIICLKTYYVVSNPEDLLTLSNNCFNKHFAFDFGKCWLGNSLITAPVPIWKVHRKLLSPSFSLQILHGYLNVLNNYSRKLTNDISKEVDNGAFCLNNYMQETSMNILSKTILGLSDREDTGLLSEYMEAVEKMLEMITTRFQNAWLHSDLIYRLVGYEKKQNHLIKILSKLSDVVIKTKIKQMESFSHDSNYYNSEHKNSFMDRLLSYEDEGRLTEKEMKDEVNTILVAGVDTTSWAMTFICVALGSHPEIQQKVYEELNEIFGNSNRDVEKEDLQKLVYLEAVIKESLRLYPVGTMTIKTVDSGFHIKNHYLRPGDHIIVSFYGANRHSSWGPDADQYRPERWLETTVPNVFNGFGMGKRDCIGKTFAMMSMKVLLCHLLRRYKVNGDATKLKMKLDYVTKAASGHFISITERHQKL